MYEESKQGQKHCLAQSRKDAKKIINPETTKKSGFVLELKRFFAFPFRPGVFARDSLLSAFCFC
jgi:hypothetical protein